MSLSFKVPGGSNGFNVETRVGDYELSYPLGASEPTALVITAEFMQLRVNYARPNVDAVLSYNNANAYFIDDDRFADKTGGVVTWQRTWATVPASWSEYYEFAYTYPGLTTAVTGSAYSITNISEDTANYPGWQFVWTTLPGLGSSWSSGEVFVGGVRYTRSNVETYHMFQGAAAVNGLANTHIEFSGVFPGYGTGGNFSNVSGLIMRGSIGRGSPRTMVIGSRIAHDYALTNGSNINSALPLFQPFQPIDSAGNTVTLLSTGSATTPNVATYSNLVSAHVEIVAEASTRRRWMGNIYERLTRYIPAQ